MSDRRSTTCRKWRQTSSGARAVCSLDRDHPGDCSWQDYFTPRIVDERRDIGPYQDVQQVKKQWESWSTGMPLADDQKAIMLIMESLLLAGRVPTQYEQNVLARQKIDPILAQILSGWIISVAAARPASL